MASLNFGKDGQMNSGGAGERMPRILRHYFLEQLAGFPGPLALQRLPHLPPTQERQHGEAICYQLERAVASEATPRTAKK